MVNTINNNGVILIDPDEERKVVTQLLIDMNAFMSVKTAEIATTLDKTTQYRKRKAGCFPMLHDLNHHGSRKAYRIKDIQDWLLNPLDYQTPVSDRHLKSNDSR